MEEPVNPQKGKKKKQQTQQKNPSTLEFFTWVDL